LSAAAIVAAYLGLVLPGPNWRALAADHFVAGMEDVPLMPGLSPIDRDEVAFDSASGRIVIAYAKGKADAKAVLAFYRQSLTQLGWQATAPGIFSRDGEVLKIEFAPDGPAAKPIAARSASKAPLMVRFSLSPHG
jgi:hypothetical protein